MYITIFLQQVGGGSMLPYLLAMFAIMYFFMIRPQMKRQKNEKTYRTALKKGDRIITTSGIHGKIVELNDKDNTCVIETMAGKMKFERSAISMELSKKLNKLTVKK